MLTEKTTAEPADVADANIDNAAADKPFGCYRDAKVLLSFDPRDHEDEIWVSKGTGKKCVDWEPMKLPRADVIGMLCKHLVGPKDSTAFVFAEMAAGRRLKSAVRAVSAIGLDVDNGTPTDRIDAALEKFGCLAVRYTTHSHLKTITEIRTDEVLRVFSNLQSVEEIDTEVMRRYCREVEKWDECLIPSVKLMGITHPSEGIMAEIAHDPMHKNRVIVFLREPYDMAKEERTQQEAMKNFARLPAMLAHHLQVPLDKSCVDPSRLFYTPRHKADADFSISLFGGRLFDWRELKPVTDEFDYLDELFAGKQSKSKTERGRALGRWWKERAHGFQIAQVIREFADVRIRGGATTGITIECPFDSGHSNPGDPDDTACFAVNAADGGYEYATVKCHHHSCQGYTSLDHLGKMLEDGWFEGEVLTDENYNAVILEEEEPEEKGAEAPGDESAGDDYIAMISALKPDSSDAEIEKAIRKMLKANLSTNKLDKAEKLLAAQLKFRGVGKARDLIAEVRRKYAASPTAKPSKDGKKTFRYEIKFDFEDAAEACKQAVLAANDAKKMPIVSVMDGYPVKLTITPEGRAKFEEMSWVSFWSYLTSLIAFVCRTDSGDGAREKVPEDVAKYVYERCDEWLRPSPKIVYSPTLLSNGSLLEEPKYHYDPNWAEFNYLLILPEGFDYPKPPKKPTKKDAMASLEWIRTELLNDFPFVDTNAKGIECREVGEAHALALLFTPHMRRMISGRTPVFMAKKPTGGTGGSLLTEAAILIHEGDPGNYVEYTSDPEELSKRIISQIRTGSGHLYFDDVDEFKSKILHRSIAAPKVVGRRMGTNDLVEAKNMFNWSANGNNPDVDDQMDRRMVWIRMNSKKSDVLERTFRHGGEGSVSGLTYEEFCKKNRGIIVSHILTIIMYWLDDGEKPFSGKKRPGFEIWCEKVGGVLEAVGVKGFLQGKSGVQVSRQVANDRAFMQDWFKKYALTPATAKEAFDWADINKLEFLSGRNEDHKREKFYYDLGRLKEKTFPLKDNDKVVSDYLLEVGDFEGELKYFLKPAPQASK